MPLSALARQLQSGSKTNIIIIKTAMLVRATVALGYASVKAAIPVVTASQLEATQLAIAIPTAVNSQLRFVKCNIVHIVTERVVIAATTILHSAIRTEAFDISLRQSIKRTN